MVQTAPPFWRGIRNWWPLAAAIAAGLCAILLLPRLAREASPEPVAPLTLSVIPGDAEWLVTWNPAATVIRKARRARLYIGDRTSGRKFELTPEQLSAGRFRHRPVRDEETFRLEVDDSSGHVSAESFRLLRR